MNRRVQRHSKLVKAIFPKIKISDFYKRADQSNRLCDNSYVHLIHECIACDVYFLAYRIRISEILPRNRKSHFTHDIIPRLSRDGFINWLHWNSRTWSSSDAIAILSDVIM